MTYYIQDKNNNIICFNDDRQIVVNSIPFLKSYGDFTEQDIKSTNKELIWFNNKIFFLEDIENDYVNKQKNKLIVDLKHVNHDYIYNSYPQTRQIDIALGMFGEELKQELIAFLSNCLDIYSVVKDLITNLATIQEVRTFDVYREYHSRLEPNVSATKRKKNV